MEKRVFFPAKDIKIEGLLSQGSSDKGVVITHPHPMYGGDMYNLVVEAIKKGFQQQGYTTLRFNFRGVGTSQGNYDKGKGEQLDLEGAIEYLKTQVGVMECNIAGYSFGAWIGALLSNKQPQICDKFFMVSPPVDFLDFNDVAKLSRLNLVIMGDQDRFAGVEHVQKKLNIWNHKAKLEIIEGSDHFFWDYLEDVENVLSKNL